MEQTTIDKLYEDFDVAIKPGQGFKYVRTRDVLDRLNKTFEGNWGVEVKFHTMVEDEVLVLVSVHLYDDDGHVKATQEGFGSARKFKNTDLGNIYKSATSKAVKSAVRNWGVALFLDEDSNQGTETGRSDASMPNMSGAPQSMPSATPGPPQTGGMPPSTGNSATPPPSSGGMPPSTPQAGVPAPPSTPEGMSNPAPPQQGVTNSMPPSTGGMPPSNPPNSGGLPPMSAVPGAPPEAMLPGDETHSITAVQKVAITSRLGAKGLTFEQISEEFYTSRTATAPDSIDGMMYVDALDMVAFLNTK
jgi:hypothetical protein